MVRTCWVVVLACLLLICVSVSVIHLCHDGSHQINISGIWEPLLNSLLIHSLLFQHQDQTVDVWLSKYRLTNIYFKRGYNRYHIEQVSQYIFDPFDLTQLLHV